MSVFETSRRLRRLTAAIALAVAPALAFAHVFPQKQSPGAGSTGPAPAAITIIFDGPLEPAFTTLTVTDPSGKAVSTAKARVDPKNRAMLNLSLPVLPPAKYTVHWAAVASDGHRTHGDYTFTVK